MILSLEMTTYPLLINIKNIESGDEGLEKPHYGYCSRIGRYNCLVNRLIRKYGVVTKKLVARPAFWQVMDKKTTCYIV